MLQEQSRQRVKDKLRREAGPHINAALSDDSVIEILLNPDGRLWVERFGEAMTCTACLDRSAAESLIATVASYCGTVINSESPILECEFPLDGSRFEAILPPVVEAPAFSIRKRAIEVHSLTDYVSSDIMSKEQHQTIIEAIKHRKNIVVVGGTSSGKTTLTNALIESMVETSPEHRLVIIEDTREIQCSAQNFVQLRTSEKKSMNSLLRATLRMRPDRIIVGEVRGSEALSLLKAWNTGHPGWAATLHANSARGALTRLEQLIAELTETPMQKFIAEAVDLIIVISKNANGERKISEIAEVKGFEAQTYLLEMR